MDEEQKLFEEFKKYISLKKKREVKKEPEKKVLNSKNGNVLCIGDLHCPFVKEGYLEHCIATAKRFDCGDIMFMGDVIDGNSTGFWKPDPDGMSPIDEFELAVTILNDWYEAFPNAKIVYGNHDLHGPRKLFDAGLPGFWVKSLKERLGAPEGWEFAFNFIIDTVSYTHGAGSANSAMKFYSNSAVFGHLHSQGMVNYVNDGEKTKFFMQVGCGIDVEQYAFKYAKECIKKPILSCAVVLGYGKEGHIIPM